MAPPETPVAAALAALAALLPEAAGRAPHPALVDAAKELQAKEVEAIRSFEAAAWECCTQLGKDALIALRAAAKANAAGDDGQEDCSSAQVLVGQNSVRQMFEQFDSNGDGLLSKDQFKDMLVTLGLTEHFSEAEIASLVGAADTNSDGSVDLQEFTEWLYAGTDGSGAKPDEEEGAAQNPKLHAAQEKSRVDEDLRRQLLQARSSLEAAEKQLAEANRVHGVAMRKAEAHFEEEHEACLTFWRSVAESSASNKLGKAIDLSKATLLGNGKYGYILKSKRRSDGAVAVVKLLSLRWAHVAATEWGKARAAADHPNIVEYADVLLHEDSDKAVHEILVAAREAGRLQTRVRRDNFPRYYVCLMQEFMNAGTVQDWMEHNLLLPGGLLVVMQTVASALSHMHQRGLTHNDIKPENVLLNQADESDSHSEVTVKLADLGLAAKSADRTDDFWQYGMTVVCMTTGEKFGERKYQPGSHEEYVEVVSQSVPRGEGVLLALGKLPGLLRKVFAQELTMKEISEADILQGWNFFDGEDPDSKVHEHSAARNRRVSQDEITKVHQLSARRSMSMLLGDPADGDNFGPMATKPAPSPTPPDG